MQNNMLKGLLQIAATQEEANLERDGTDVVSHAHHFHFWPHLTTIKQKNDLLPASEWKQQGRETGNPPYPSVVQFGTFPYCLQHIGWNAGAYPSHVLKLSLGYFFCIFFGASNLIRKLICWPEIL